MNIEEKVQNRMNSLCWAKQVLRQQNIIRVYIIMRKVFAFKITTFCILMACLLQSCGYFLPDPILRERKNKSVKCFLRKYFES